LTQPTGEEGQVRVQPTLAGGPTVATASRIGGVKVSVSLSDGDVAFLDAYATEHGAASRSAAVQQAVAVLRERQLGAEYSAAFTEWHGSVEARAWEVVVGDGVGADETW